MIDKETSRIILGTMLEKRSNKRCMDCSSESVDFASVSNGTFICGECAESHRSLEENVSYVLSLSDKSWSLADLKLMSSGGNSALQEYLNRFEFPERSIPYLYNTKALCFYRKYLKAVSNEEPLVVSQPSPEEAIQIGKVYHKQKPSFFNRVVNSGKDVGVSVSNKFYEMRDSKSFQNVQESTSNLLKHFKNGITKASTITKEWTGGNTARRIKQRTAEAYDFMAKKTKDAIRGAKEQINSDESSANQKKEQLD